MNTTTTTEPPSIASDVCPFAAAIPIINNYAQPAVSVLGVPTNVYCIVVFSLIIRHERQLNGHMFKYLLLKSVHDTIQFIVNSFAPLVFCTDCPTSRTYAAQIWFIWFYFYVECINELCSALFEVAATLDCLINLNMKFEWCKKNVVFYVTSAVITIYPCIYYIFWGYEFNIVKVTTNTTSFYTYEYAEFSYTKTSFALRLMHGLFRDGVCMIVLVILNVLILLTMKQSFKRKRRMTAATSPSTVTVASSSTAAHNAERNVIIMIVLNGVNYFAGHLIIFVKYCVFTRPSAMSSCLLSLGLFAMNCSYVTPFFIYFACNKLFRVYALGGKRSGQSGGTRSVPKQSMATSRINQRNV
jgi:hypothetical protein